MENKLDANSAQPTVTPAQTRETPVWHRPQVMKISLNETLNSSGSGGDATHIELT